MMTCASRNLPNIVSHGLGIRRHTGSKKGLPGGNSEWEPPDSIPNSVVKLLSADDSVGSPHVKVGHRQASNAEPCTPGGCRAFLWTWGHPTDVSESCGDFASRIPAPHKTRALAFVRLVFPLRSEAQGMASLASPRGGTSPHCIGVSARRAHGQRVRRDKGPQNVCLIPAHSHVKVGHRQASNTSPAVSLQGPSLPLASPQSAGAGACQRRRPQEVSMFEYDRDVMATLLQQNREFKNLYDKHEQLDQDVHEAEIGTRPVDHLELHKWKKEKLFVKDRMAMIIEAYKRERV
jgi:uncharacterized protein YdcH (DUF465 family)